MSQVPAEGEVSQMIKQFPQNDMADDAIVCNI
jgi:hypothetical protein